MALNSAVKTNWIELQKKRSVPVNAIGLEIGPKDHATLKVWREEGIDQYMLKERPEEDASPVGEAGFQPHGDAAHPSDEAQPSAEYPKGDEAQPLDGAHPSAEYPKGDEAQPSDGALPEEAREDTGPSLDQMPSGPGAATIWAMQMASKTDQSDD